MHSVPRHPHFQRRVESECAIVEQVDHPFILDSRGIIYKPEATNFLWEYTPKCVQDIARDIGRREAVGYACELLAAVGYIHHKRFLHRNIHVESVRISSSGHVRLGGFVHSAHIANGQRTRTICGIPRYMAPERMLGQEHGFLSDWYSYGLFLYEMLTGQQPFQGCEGMDLYEKVIGGEALAGLENLESDSADLVERLVTPESDRLGPISIEAHAFFSS
eukprot:g4129.t1